MQTDLGRLTKKAQNSAKNIVDNIIETSPTAIIIGDDVRISRAELEKYLTTFVIDTVTMSVREGMNSVNK